MLCFAAMEIHAADAGGGEDGGIHKDETGSTHMRSVKIEDASGFSTLMEAVKTDPKNPTGNPAVLTETAVNRRVVERNPYHMMTFSQASDPSSPIAFVAMGRMPVFGFAAGKSYDPVQHAAVIEKWKSLGVRHTAGDHDERVENFGLLNWVPFIHPEVTGETRLEIYSKMLARALALKAEGALMTDENNHLLECTDKALPYHIVLLLHPEFRDIELLQSLGFGLDTNPEFEKFYNVPRVMLTYSLA